MAPSWISTLASVSMAIGPPLVYADQYVSILRKKSSAGFSIDVCGVLLIANITRCFYWIGARFEIALLVQSILMIIFQIVLLEACIRYRSAPSPSLPSQRPEHPDDSSEGSHLVANDADSQEALEGPAHLGGLGATAEQVPRAPTLRSRLLGKFWAWDEYGTFIEFLAFLIVGHVVGIVIFWGLFRFGWYTEVLGALALGLESTLPIPQLITNFRRKSLAGFRMTVLLGWIGGDAYKTVYFFLQEGNTPQFKICAVFQLSVDCLIALQAIIYRGRAPLSYKSTSTAEHV